MEKKNYAAPCAEPILFAPAEAVTASTDWSWTWKWGTFENEEIASVQGVNPLWDGYLDTTSTNDPY